MLINFSQSQSATIALNKSAVSECARQNIELFENFFKNPDETYLMGYRITSIISYKNGYFEGWNRADQVLDVKRCLRVLKHTKFWISKDVFMFLSIPSSGCQKMSSCSYANLIVVAIKSSYDGKVPCLLNREV